MKKLGIDEAGRGCIIGPMIVAGVLIESNKENLLKAVGVRDSKKLTREKREHLLHIITESAEAVVVTKAFPEEIDSINLNDITYSRVIQVIDIVTSSFKVDLISVDRVGKEDIVIRKIQDLGISENVKFKADERFTEVSAASIVAKVFRDRIIDSLKEKYGDFGSGYPSDPKTRKWIIDTYSSTSQPPKIIRRSWKSLIDLAPNYYSRKGI
ncbi:ribonuclease HII [Acidianus sp. RZ1]|uniref:ribonuclease HII n=1 Tax=Acidianus sp. RZ1 TaxID=1540082 RepID=UPI001491E20E|nr:ribonuclease HII [Acidianus sp. RZ1]NON62444.1 ribonuclease HII [Acidianus sp. RZ1]